MRQKEILVHKVMYQKVNKLIAENITKLTQPKVFSIQRKMIISKVSCVPQKTHSQQAMTKVKYVLVPDVNYFQ
jgi:hypothetical protein